jgi:replicative DNA helicase
VYTEQLPPHDDEAEEAVLGSLLIDSDATPRVAVFLESDDFFRQKHGWVYGACMALFARNEPINQISIADELSRRQQLDETGGLPFLSHLIATVPTSVYAENYGQVVRRLSVMRRLISAGGRISEIGYRAELDEEEALREAEDLVYKIRMNQSQRDLVPLGTALEEFLEEGLQAGARREGVGSGFTDLDRVLGGLQPSDLLILAARPSVGKSAMALNLARSVVDQRRADGRRRVAALFSVEMARDQVVERLLSSESSIGTRRIREGNWTDREEALIMRAVGELADLDLYIDDTPQLSVIEMRSKARRLFLDRGIDLIIVDYLQMMVGSGNGFGGNRVQEISEISRSLKALARDLNVPVLALSQLSRAVESRPTHEPQLSDLRDSGAIEQDADVVAFLYRPEMVFTEEEWERTHEGQYPRGLAEVIVAKHRNGPLARFSLVFREETTTFMDLFRPDSSDVGSMFN